MVSIRDVASKSGFGVGTVSRALNGSGYISEDTKNKIMEAARELNYQPNELAKNLYRNHSGFIGIVVPDIEHPFFASLLKCVEQELYLHGYKCMACDISGKERRELEFIEMLQKKVMDGLILCVDPLDEVKIDKLIKPMVCIERKWADRIPLIHSDHIRGGRIAADIFIKKGCKKVLQFVPARVTKDPYIKRHVELQRILTANHVEVLQADLEPNQMGYGYDTGSVKSFESMIDEADGIFASDVVAVGCLKRALEKGINVPDQLKIIGYDGMPLTRLVHPTITAICQNIPGLAKAGVETIIKMIHRESSIIEDVTIDISLQKGGTV